MHREHAAQAPRDVRPPLDVALHVHSFGPRGPAAGFARHTHEAHARDDVNERTERPLDAIGALAYLSVRPCGRRA